MTTSYTISDAFKYRDRKSLESIYQELTKEKVIIGAFMTKFLDKFERKMNPDNPDTPIWNLYHAKMNEYTRIDNLIKYTQYYLERL